MNIRVSNTVYSLPDWHPIQWAGEFCYRHFAIVLLVVLLLTLGLRYWAYQMLPPLS